MCYNFCYHHLDLFSQWLNKWCELSPKLVLCPLTRISPLDLAVMLNLTRLTSPLLRRRGAPSTVSRTPLPLNIACLPDHMSL